MTSISARSPAVAGWMAAKSPIMLTTSRTMPALAPFRLVQCFGFDQQHGADRSDDHLRDALAPPYREGQLAVIDQQDLELAAVIRVDRAGCVEHRDAMLCRQPGARPDLSLVALGQGDG